MSTFYWAASGGGDFSDPNNWLYTDSNGNTVTPPGPPGASDDVFITTSGTVMANGETVYTLHLQGTLAGDIDVTYLLIGSPEQSILTGTVKAGIAETIDFRGVKLTADSIEGGKGSQQQGNNDAPFERST